MKYMKYLSIILLLAMSLCASADVYTIKPGISDRELTDLYVEMLAQFSRHAETLWHETQSEPKTGYWGNGISGGNEGIRAVANTALVQAILLKKTDALDASTRQVYLDHAIAGIRYAAETHITGARKCIDGKQWGNSWQSAMWTANMGFAAWILWDDLDAGLRKSVEQVVAHEANRFLAGKPPGNRWADTKAEENGWDQTCISLAANMFREHPNAPRWERKSIEYMMNVVSVPRDAKDTTIVDGRPVKDWVSTVNYHPDFTLENHGFFHPTYAMVSPAEVGQGAIFYAYAGRPMPQAAGHNLKQNWMLLQSFMLPSGYWAFAQGMDWALNSDGHIHYLAWLSAYSKDPLAAGMEKQVVQYLRGHRRVHGDETFAGPASRLGFAREGITGERIAYCLLFHKLLGSAASERTIREAKELIGVCRYSLVDVITHRTGSKFASFSWKNKIMGLVMPIGPGHEGNPYFTTPYTSSLVGSFVLSPDGAHDVRVVQRSWHKTENGFETEGTLLLSGGLLEQKLKFTSIGEKTVIYEDVVTARADVSIAQELGVPVGIENDEFTGNRRTLYHQDGSQIIIGPDTDSLIRIPGKWANVDGRLGIVQVIGSGLAYRDVPKYNRDGGREDYLYASYSDKQRELKAGEEVARRVVIFFVETSPAETAHLAEAARIEETPSGSVLHLTLPEGGEWLLEMADG